jgi:FkbM family methyltransferase
MQSIFVRSVTRRYPFKSIRVPWVSRLYCYPLDRWPLARAALFGAPHFLTFLLLQHLSPIRPKGLFHYFINGQEKPIRFNGFNTQFQAIYRKCFIHGYEPQITALLDLICPDDGVFYDIGSNWGWFSLFLASRPGFRGEIHAFEPFPPSFSDIKSVVEQAGLTERIQCHNMALSDHLGEAFMHLPDRFQSGLAMMKNVKRAGDKAIKVSTLDTLNLAPPSVIKVDVESAEIKVLRGGAKVIARQKPMIIFENTRFSDNPIETLRPMIFLQQSGYLFFQVCWLRSLEETTALLGDDIDPQPQDSELLALSPFDVKERYIHSDGMNIFACHKDKVSQLQRFFEWRTP